MARELIALRLAALALAAAALGAVGPADAERTSYHWPPADLPARAPATTTLWTPLLLANRTPERIDATLPCRPAPLGERARVSTILATARFADDGLRAWLDERNGLHVSVGGELVAEPARAGAAGATCEYGLEIEGGRWTLTTPAGDTRTGELEAMPVVNGLFSDADLGAAAHPEIEVTTTEHRTRATTRQRLAWSLAALAALSALLLLAWTPLTRALRSSRRGIGSALRSLAAVDAVVGLALAAWWLVAPSLFDDGWTIARQTAFETSGGFSNYYDSLAAPLPLGYWLEWMQHWLTRSTEALVLLRVPALLCLAATWIVCRWLQAQIRGRDTMSSAPLWAMASAFLALALSWGMTLRLEPTVALLVTGVLACSVRFLQTRSVVPLVVAAAIVPLAATAHPGGLLALAPLICVLPALAPWVREHFGHALTIVLASAALTLTLAFVGSDAAHRLHDARTISETSLTVVDWRQELNRYSPLVALDDQGALAGYSTPLRRASVALLLLALAAYLLRRRRSGEAPLVNLPAAALGVSLLLFVATPSKWPWHFGALVGVGAAAVAAETARLVAERERTRSWEARPFVVVGVATVAIAWAWWPRGPWNLFDLRVLDWTLGFERFVPLFRVAVGLPPLLLGGAVALAWLRAGPRFPGPWRVATWSATLVAAPLLVFTVGVLAVDGWRGTWTPARQAVDDLTAGSRCGLADEIAVPLAGSTHPLTPAGAARSASARWVPDGSVPDVHAFGPSTLLPKATPWYGVAGSGDRRLGLFVAGAPAAGDRLLVEWGQQRSDEIRAVGSADVDLLAHGEREAHIPWRFIAIHELTDIPAPATHMRLVLRESLSSPGSPVAVTAPVEYVDQPLRRALGAGGPALVMPNARTFFPCADMPSLAGGVVEPPTTIIATREIDSPVRYPDSSPFTGALDLFPLQRLPFADQDPRLASFVAYRLESEIPGGVLVPPDAEKVRD